MLGEKITLTVQQVAVSAWRRGRRSPAAAMQGPSVHIRDAASCVPFPMPSGATRIAVCLQDWFTRRRRKEKDAELAELAAQRLRQEMEQAGAGARAAPVAATPDGAEGSAAGAAAQPAAAGASTAGAPLSAAGQASGSTSVAAGPGTTGAQQAGSTPVASTPAATAATAAPDEDAPLDEAEEQRLLEYQARGAAVTGHAYAQHQLTRCFQAEARHAALPLWHCGQRRAGASSPTLCASLPHPGMCVNLFVYVHVGACVPLPDCAPARLPGPLCRSSWRRPSSSWGSPSERTVPRWGSSLTTSPWGRPLRLRASAPAAAAAPRESARPPRSSRGWPRRLSRTMTRMTPTS